MSSYNRIGVVTGANKVSLSLSLSLSLYIQHLSKKKIFHVQQMLTMGVPFQSKKGIGYAIVRQLALQHSASNANKPTTPSLLVYLTARDQARGEAALAEIKQDPQLKAAKALVGDGGAVQIMFRQLDITDRESLKKFVEGVREEHGGEDGGVDFVVNNAAIYLPGFDSEVVKTTLDCNYYSTMGASRAFLPLLKQNGRMVNVASTVGGLSYYPDALRDRFLATQTEADVDAIMHDFQSAVDTGKEEESGFPKLAYEVSKAGLIGATRALALAAKREGKGGVLINSCCPGYVKTDLNGRGKYFLFP
ncbi:unnamed protein product [Periconia digitata]|uniref:Carbonyl reductase n=1 Tax=Periconia digitata TaxID=1303443 RepID=A0A9W4XH97_9PLEO|nr:unnamed protein product [Periconia digitata]